MAACFEFIAIHDEPSVLIWGWYVIVLPFCRRKEKKEISSPLEEIKPHILMKTAQDGFKELGIFQPLPKPLCENRSVPDNPSYQYGF